MEIVFILIRNFESLYLTRNINNLETTKLDFSYPWILGILRFSIFSQLSLIFTKKNMKNKDHLGTNGTQNLPKRTASTKKNTVVLIR